LLAKIRLTILSTNGRGKMPLITTSSSAKTQQLKLKINTDLVEELKNYCLWAGMENNLDHFFTEAAKMVLHKDREWIAAKRDLK
jgi:hypothetical protein